MAESKNLIKLLVNMPGTILISQVSDILCAEQKELFGDFKTMKHFIE